MVAKKYPNLKGMLLIVTYGRSGSTILQSPAQTIPVCHIAGENYNALEGLFRASQRVRRSSNTWGKKPHPSNHPWYGADQLVARRFERKLVDVFIEEVLCPPSAARWYGFKEIRYPSLQDDFPNFLNFCRRNFPNAFFIFNSRNGEDVAESAWWKNHSRQSVLEMVAEMDQRFAIFADENPTYSHHVRYEDIVCDPVRLRPLFDKLGESLDIAAAQRILAQHLTH